MNSVGDIEINIGSELDTAVGSALFLKLFPKIRDKCFYCQRQLEKQSRFQVIYNSNISYFLEFPLDV